jgi:hypothetical protein
MAGTGISYSSTLCCFYNPALLAISAKKNITIFSGILSLGRLEGCLSGQTHISPRAALSVNVLYRGDPFINNLYDLDENKAATGFYTTATTKLGLAYLLTRHLSAGLSIGIFYQNMPSGIRMDGSLEYSNVTSVGGLDLGLLYRMGDKSALGLAISNLLVNMDWQLGSSSALQATALNNVPPDFAAGYSRVLIIAQKPAMAALDIHASLVDGDLKMLERPEAEVRCGAQWQATDLFSIRAGLSGFKINGDLLRDRMGYAYVFAPVISAGFGLDLKRYNKGMFLNYALRTDKVWAGIDQQIDLSYSF